MKFIPQILFDAEGAGTAGAEPAAPPADTGSAPAASGAEAGKQEGATPSPSLLTGDFKKEEAPAADDKAKEGDKPAEGDKAKEPDPLAVVPEDGKYEFTLPDGVELDADMTALASPLLKEAGFTRAEANKAAGVYMKMQEAMAAKLAENWTAQNREWQAASKTDKEFGGDKFDVSLANANQAVTKFGTPALSEFLRDSGAGNHPEMIRFMNRVGTAFKDDSPPNTETNAPGKFDPIKAMYPGKKP